MTREEIDSWEGAVSHTQQHTRYQAAYNFTLENDDWTMAEGHGEWCKDLPHVLALDCEMCLTKEPGTSTSRKELLRLSVVSGTQGTQTLINTLVRPTMEVVDFRSEIHGIQPSDLQQPGTVSFQEARAMLLERCCDQTVIIGHALNNDLAALKLAHTTVVDTAFLFSLENNPRGSPGLKDVAAALLQVQMPETHDSIHDACIALDVAKHWLANGSRSVPRAPITQAQLAEKKMTAEQRSASSLLVHHIKGGLDAGSVSGLLLPLTKLCPQSVDDVVRLNGKPGRTHLRYESPEQARQAFDALPQAATADTWGFMMKKVELPDGTDYVIVRLNQDT